MTWRIEWTERALKDLERVDSRTRDRVLRTAERFAQSGHGDVRRIKGSEGELALRVGDWRAFFILLTQEQVLRFLRVRPRGRAYRA